MSVCSWKGFKPHTHHKCVHFSLERAAGCAAGCRRCRGGHDKVGQGAGQSDMGRAQHRRLGVGHLLPVGKKHLHKHSVMSGHAGQHVIDSVAWAALVQPKLQQALVAAARKKRLGAVCKGVPYKPCISMRTSSWEKGAGGGMNCWSPVKQMGKKKQQTPSGLRCGRCGKCCPGDRAGPSRWA